MDEANVLAEVTDVLQEGRDTQKDKYVTFKSGSEHFALKIEYVSEIIVYQDITPIPESENFIKGLINLRGKIIPVIDVRLRFNQEPFEYNDRTCIIVINYKSTVVGLIVEKPFKKGQRDTSSGCHTCPDSRHLRLRGSRGERKGVSGNGISDKG